MAPKMTKGIISRDEAIAISPDYVKFIEGDYDIFQEKVLVAFEGLKRGQECITYIDGKFVRVKVTSMNYNDFRAVDGPIVRVGNGEYTWRVDGDKYAYPV